jgi:hypothetical protein
MLSENVWLAVLALFGSAVLGPGVVAIIRRALPSRTDDARAKVDEVTADATAAGAWQALYIELKHRVDGLEIEVGHLRDSLRDANDRVKVQAMRLQAVTRWALLLRDEVIRLAGIIPPPPPEIEDALTNLSP